MSIYLDHAAGGPLHPAAARAMEPWLGTLFGNPSGAHAVARRARQAVDEARDVMAAFSGFPPAGIVFTSGGTEADNLGVLGPLAARPGALVVSAVEHPAVLEAARASRREVRLVPVDADGRIDPARLRPLLDPPVAVVSIQMVNHETGVVQDIDGLAARVRKWAPGAVFHCDAVQAAAWTDLPGAARAVDALTVSGHKIGGPQGVGVLAVRAAVPLNRIVHGGGQEAERRSGTHNVAAIVGLAAAVAHIDPSAPAAVGARRDTLGRLVLAGVEDAVVTAADSPRAPGHLHMTIPGVESESLLFLLDEAGVCASAGAACASGALDPSPVLLAMGIDKRDASGALRLTLGPSTTDDDVETAAAAVIAAAHRLRGDRCAS